MQSPLVRAAAVFGVVTLVIFVTKNDMFYSRSQRKMKGACFNEEPDMIRVEGLGKIQNECATWPWWSVSSGAAAVALLLA